METENDNLLERILEQYEDAEFLTANGLDDAVIGVCEDMNKPPRLIYSVKKCIEITAKDMEVDESELEDGETVEDKKYQLAVEYLEYNTFVGYVGEKTPVWCRDDF